jgi:hypothetical protein
MDKITHNKQSYNVPIGWGDVKTIQLIKLKNLFKMFTDTETGELQIDEEKIFPRIVEIMVGINREEVLKMNYNTVMIIKTMLMFMSTPIPEIKTKRDFIKTNNVLLKVKDYEKLNFGEFIDTQHLMKQEDDESIIKSVSLLIDVYRPKNIWKGKFKDKKLDLTLDQKVNLLKEMNCIEYHNISFFLSNGLVKYMNNMVRYLNLKALQINMKTILASVGVIIFGLWTYVMTKLRIYPKYSK